MKINENNDDILENKDYNLENSNLNGSTQLSHASNIKKKRPFSYIEGEVKRNKKRRGEIWDYTYNLREKREKNMKNPVNQVIVVVEQVYMLVDIFLFMLEQSTPLT